MSEFIKELKEIQNHLEREQFPTLTVKKLKYMLMKLIDVSIKENQRLNAEIEELKKKHETPPSKTSRHDLKTD